jgi:hypothetical protein
MPNVFNRKAFRSVASDANSPVLVRTYCALVLMELALKEHLGVPNLSHNLPDMLRRLATNHRPARAAINQQRSDLMNKLSVLYAQGVDNSIGMVRAASYPDLRYVRHVEDWGNSACTNDQLNALRVCVDRIRYFLKSNLGVSSPL